jgi:putative Mn2+ efflux pump MntP
MSARAALLLGAFFVVVAAIYWVAPYLFQPSHQDYTGFVLLGVLGVAMAFGFTVLIRGSRDL